MLHVIFLLGLLGCGDKAGDTSDNPEPMDSPQPDSPPDTGIDIPDPPGPFSLSISGTDNETLTFDAPTCQIPEAVPNFKLYWRLSSGAHKFVLRLFINADYQGAGSYDNGSQNISVRLQEEAGGSGRFYQTEAENGDNVSLAIETDEDGMVWGEVSLSSMHNGESSINISPSSFPIWCTPENTN